MRVHVDIRLVGTVALILALPACEGMRDQLGLTKQSPDEFRVVSRAPLSLPPDFNLRPPRPGVARPQEGSPTAQARRAVFRTKDGSKIVASDSSDPPVPSDGRTVGERAFLKAAGVDKAEADIRALIDRESDELREANSAFLETLVFWRQKDAPGVVVDAAAEAKRLRENIALGKAVTEGETPTIKRRKRGLLEGIF